MFGIDDGYIEEVNAAYWTEESEMKSGTHPSQILERVQKALGDKGGSKEITFMDYNISGSRVIVSVGGSVYGIFNYIDNEFLSTPDSRLNEILESNGFGLYNLE